jgi:hypothetical protein
MDLDKMCNLYRGPSIDASYQVSFNLAEGFQRRRLKFDYRLYHFFCFGVMPLLTLAGSEGIHVMSDSSIFFVPIYESF